MGSVDTGSTEAEISAPKAPVAVSAGSHRTHSIRRQPATLPFLTTRQREVLDLMLAGLTERQAALHLRLSPHTIHNHVKKIYRAYGVSSRIQLHRTHEQLKNRRDRSRVSGSACNEESTDTQARSNGTQRLAGLRSIFERPSKAILLADCDGTVCFANVFVESRIIGSNLRDWLPEHDLCELDRVLILAAMDSSTRYESYGGSALALSIGLNRAVFPIWDGDRLVGIAASIPWPANPEKHATGESERLNLHEMSKVGQL